VAALVGHQNGEQGERKREAGHQKFWVAPPRPESVHVTGGFKRGQVVIEVVGEAGAHGRRGNEGYGKKQYVQPDTIGADGFP